MPTLISLLNSGESLEKAVVLTKLALEQNPSFYSNYQKITILYCENLPKKEKDMQIHGTLGGIIENLKDDLKYKKLEDLWEDKENILNKAENLNKISKRTKEKLLTNKNRFDKIIPKFPWYYFLEDYKKFLINEFLDNGKVCLQFLNYSNELPNIIQKTSSFYLWKSKLYTLNSEGSIGQQILHKEHCSLNLELTEKDKRQIERLNKNPVLSPNVLTFILGTYYSCCNKNEDILVGYRYFKKIKRTSYDLGIKFLRKKSDLNIVEEPKNKLFNDLLDEVDKKYRGISLEKKVNLAIYNHLNKSLV